MRATSQKASTAICSVLSDDFVEGYIKTYASLNRLTSLKFDQIVIWHPSISHLNEENQARLSEIFPKISFWQAEEREYINIFKFRDKALRTPKRLAAAFLAIEYFRFTNYESVIGLDTDLLFTGPINELFDRRRGFSVVRAIDHRNDLPHPFFNTGVFVIGRDLLVNDFYQKILQYPYVLKDFELRHSGFGKADQAILNVFFEKHACHVRYLPMKYNATKRFFPNGSSIITKISEEDIRIIHYVGHKPWQKTKNETEIIYTEIESLWHDFNHIKD
jgi:lipopolysaccharide biosynthesis glycosyltransferase